MDWLWQNVISGWIGSLLALAFSALVGWLATRRSKWLSPTLWALGSFALILLSLAALSARAYFLQQTRTEVTVNNVERLVRDWSDTFRFSVRKLGTNNTYHWAYQVSGVSGIPITVARSTALPHYLTLAGALSVASPYLELFKALKKSEADALIGQLRIEMNRLNISYSGFTNPPEKFVVFQEIPISNDLTDYRFVTTVNEVNNAVLLLRQILFTTLNPGVSPPEGKTPITPNPEPTTPTPK